MKARAPTRCEYTLTRAPLDNRFEEGLSVVLDSLCRWNKDLKDSENESDWSLDSSAYYSSSEVMLRQFAAYR